MRGISTAFHAVILPGQCNLQVFHGNGFDGRKLVLFWGSGAWLCHERNPIYHHGCNDKEHIKNQKWDK